MNKSTLQAINQIIDTDDCPFTQFEVHGFFIGLLVSSHSKESRKEKIIKFLDLSSNIKTNKLIDELSNTIRQELINQTLSVYSFMNDDSEKGRELESAANSLSEWTYYFLIGYQGESSLSDDPDIQEILDIFDEISQVNQKYKFDGTKSSSQESLDEINSFIVKSTLYLYERRIND